MRNLLERPRSRIYSLLLLLFGCVMCISTVMRQYAVMDAMVGVSSGLTAVFLATSHLVSKRATVMTKIFLLLSATSFILATVALIALVLRFVILIRK